jgi:hypothetical protein
MLSCGIRYFPDIFHFLGIFKVYAGDLKKKVYLCTQTEGKHLKEAAGGKYFKIK